MKRLLASLLIALGLAALTATPALAQAWRAASSIGAGPHT